MQRETQTWEALLRPHVPEAPVAGAVELCVSMTYPHRKGCPKRDQEKVIPKVTRPDGDNVAKHLIDLLARMRFMGDDSHVSRLVIEKWHGPEYHVGIQIAINPMEVA
jgi:Holliday junction resolvase RusA-like endonuclease